MARFSFQRISPSSGGKPPKMTFAQFSDLYGSELATKLEPLMERLTANPSWELGDGRLEDVATGCSKEFSGEVAKLRQWVIGTVERHHSGAFGFHIDHLLPEAFGELADEAMLIVDPSRAKKAVFFRNIASASGVKLPRSRKREDVLAFLDMAKEALRSKPTAAEKVARAADESIATFMKRKADAEAAASGADVGEIFGMISWVRNTYEDRRGGNAPKPEDPRRKLEAEIEEVRQKIAGLQAEEKDFALRPDYANAATRRAEWSRLEAMDLASLHEHLKDLDAANAKKTRLAAAAAIVVNAPQRPGDEAEPMGTLVLVDAAKLAAKTQGPNRDELRAEITRLQNEIEAQSKAVNDHEAAGLAAFSEARTINDVTSAAKKMNEANREYAAAATAKKKIDEFNEQIKPLFVVLDAAVTTEENAAKSAVKKSKKVKVTVEAPAAIKLATVETATPPEEPQPVKTEAAPTGDPKAVIAAQIAAWTAKGDANMVTALTVAYKALGG